MEFVQVHKPSNSSSYTPLSEHFEIYSIINPNPGSSHYHIMTFYICKSKPCIQSLLCHDILHLWIQTLHPVTNMSWYFTSVNPNPASSYYHVMIFYICKSKPCIQSLLCHDILLLWIQTLDPVTTLSWHFTSVNPNLASSHYPVMAFYVCESKPWIQSLLCHDILHLWIQTLHPVTNMSWHFTTVSKYRCRG
jgi:hypothetical protein